MKVKDLIDTCSNYVEMFHFIRCDGEHIESCPIYAIPDHLMEMEVSTWEMIWSDGYKVLYIVVKEDE